MLTNRPHQACPMHGFVVVTTECGHRVRLHGNQVFEFRGGQIASIQIALDATDPPTAAYMARQLALGTFAHAR